MKKIALIIILPILSSCTSYGRAVSLPMPLKPTWEVLKHDKYQCLNIDQWSNLGQRSIIKDGYIRELEAVIKSTHE